MGHRTAMVSILGLLGLGALVAGDEVERLQKMPPGWADEAIRFTPGAERYWVEAPHGAGVELSLSGTRLGVFARVRPHRTPDGALYFDVEKTDGAWKEIADLGTRPLPGRPVRAGGGRIVAYLLDTEEGKLSVHLPERGTFPFDDLGGVEATPGGDHVVFWGVRDREHRIYLDGHPCLETFDYIDWVAIHPEGSRVAFWGVQGERSSLVLAGMEDDALVPLERRSEGFKVWPQYSPNGVLAYRAVPMSGRSRGEFVHLGEERFGPHRYTSIPVVSPDGKSVGFTAHREGKLVAMRNDSEGPPREQVRGIVFSPDGGRMAYAAFDPGTGWTVEGAPPPPERLDEVGEIVFDGDGDRIAYAAKIDEGWRVLANGATSEAYDRVWGLGFREEPPGITFGARRGPDLLRVTLPIPAMPPEGSGDEAGETPDAPPDAKRRPR